MKDKNFLVVGGSRGIGAEILRKLVKKNSTVFAASREKSQFIEENSVKFLSLDVTQEDLSVLKDFLPERLDGVVYCPGTITLRPFQSLKMIDFTNDINVNLLGLVKVLQQVIGALKRSDTSSVVSFSTVATKVGLNYHASISSAKAAIEGLSVSLASEYSKSNIRFNVIAPSLTRTDLAQNLLSTPDKEKASADRHPLKRVGSVEDIASMAVFLLSSDSSWITGQVIGVDGGLSSVKPL
jgi:NAD(P)-dependent dehydrogenase (short-subunit alcohol dehydrogenase family)